MTMPGKGRYGGAVPVERFSIQFGLSFNGLFPFRCDFATVSGYLSMSADRRGLEHIWDIEIALGQKEGPDHE
jgi:hypothetical protein